MCLPCVRVFAGLLVYEPNITFTLFYDSREHRASIQTRGLAPGVWRPPDRGRPIPCRLPCVRVFVGSFVCEPNITFTLFYDPREHRASIQTRQPWPPGVWRPPDRGRPIPCRLPCVRVFVGSFVYEPNITFTLFYDPREHRASIQTHGLAPRRMASARSRSTRPICTFHASGYSLAHSSANRTSLSLYSMIHANTERLSRRVAWHASRRMASARSRSTYPFCTFHASGCSLAHSSANRTSLSLYSMTHANTERLSRRAAWLPGVWRPPDRGRLIDAIFTHNSRIHS